MEVMKLLEELEDVLEASKGFGNNAFVNRSELLDIIRDIRLKLPDEIKQAQWIKDEKQRILTEARTDSQSLIEEAEEKVKDLVAQDKITLEAEENAKHIINEANEQATEIMLSAYEYSDEIFKNLNEKLTNISKTVQKNRNDLKTLSEKIDKSK